MKKFKIYIFDFDGTLVNSYAACKKLYNLIFNPFGKVVDDKLTYELIKGSIDDAFKKIVGDSSKIKEFMGYLNEVVNSGVLVKDVTLYEETLEIVKFINQNGIISAIATGNFSTHVQRVLNNLNVPEFAKVLACRDHVKEAKPNPEIIKFVLDKLNYNGNLKDVAYIGDAIDDVKCAHNAGVSAILVDRFNEFDNSAEYIKITNLKELFF